VKKLFVLSAVILGLSACSSADKKSMDDAKNEAPMADKASDQEKESEKSEDSGMAGSKASCTLDKDTRVIEVKKTEAGGCELFYTKFGESKSVASSGFGTQYCEEVKDRIESNLKKAGFTCQ
jgi:hypothetical protein